MKTNKAKTITFALKKSLPVLFGYLFLGSAFGITIHQLGYNWIWSGIMALFVYAGSGQFLLASMIASHSTITDLAIMTLFLNSRHIFYGLTYIEKFRSYGWRFPSLVYSLTDETYGVNTSFTSVPNNVNEGDARLLIGIFDHIYWIIGCMLGAVAGELIKIDFTGIEFSMTSLFVVIFIDQVRSSKSKIPAIVGVCTAIICLIIFGMDNFILPSLIVTVALLMALKPAIAKAERSVD